MRRPIAAALWSAPYLLYGCVHCPLREGARDHLLVDLYPSLRADPRLADQIRPPWIT